MDQARISVSQDLSHEFLRTKIYGPIFGWTTSAIPFTQSLKGSNSANPQATVEKIIHLYKQTIYELSKISLKHFYGYEGDYGKFSCDLAQPVVSVSRRPGGEAFVDPILSAETGSYSRIHRSPLHIPSKVVCFMVGASVQTSFQNSPDTTPNDAKVGVKDGAKYSSWFPDPIPNEETSSDAFEKLFHATLPTICSREQLESADDYSKTSECSVKVPLAVLNLFPRTFGKLSRDINLLQSLVSSSTPLTTKDAMQAVVKFEHFCRRFLKEGDFSVYPGGSMTTTYRDWTYEVWRNIPVKEALTVLEVNEKGEIVGDFVAYDDFEDAQIWEYSAGNDKKFDTLPNVGVFCTAMEPPDSPTYTQGNDGALKYNDEMVLLAPIGDETGVYSNSCGWLPIYVQGDLEALATAQFLKAFARQKQEAEEALKRKIEMKIEAALSIEGGVSSSSKGHSCSDSPALSIIVGFKDVSTVNIAHLPDGKQVASYVPGVENEHVHFFLGISGDPLTFLSSFDKSKLLPDMTLGFEISYDFTEESTSLEFGLEVSVPQSIVDKAFPPSESGPAPGEDPVDFIAKKIQSNAGQDMLLSVTTITGEAFTALYNSFHRGFHTPEADDALAARVLSIPALNVVESPSIEPAPLFDIASQAEPALRNKGDSNALKRSIQHLGKAFVQGVLGTVKDQLPTRDVIGGAKAEIQATIALQIVVKKIQGGGWAINWEETFSHIKISKKMSYSIPGLSLGKMKIEYTYGTKISLEKAKEMIPSLETIPKTNNVPAPTGRRGMLSKESGSKNLLDAANESSTLPSTADQGNPPLPSTETSNTAAETGNAGSTAGRLGLLSKESGSRNLLDAANGSSALPSTESGNAAAETGVLAFKRKVARHTKRLRP